MSELYLRMRTSYLILTKLFVDLDRPEIQAQKIEAKEIAKQERQKRKADEGDQQQSVHKRQRRDASQQAHPDMQQGPIASSSAAPASSGAEVLGQSASAHEVRKFTFRYEYTPDRVAPETQPSVPPTQTLDWSTADCSGRNPFPRDPPPPPRSRTNNVQRRATSQRATGPSRHQQQPSFVPAPQPSSQVPPAHIESSQGSSSHWPQSSNASQIRQQQMQGPPGVSVPQARYDMFYASETQLLTPNIPSLNPTPVPGHLDVRNNQLMGAPVASSSQHQYPFNRTIQGNAAHYQSQSNQQQFMQGYPYAHSLTPSVGASSSMGGETYSSSFTPQQQTSSNGEEPEDWENYFYHFVENGF